MNRLAKKWETAKKWMPAPVLKGSGKNRVGIIAFGSSDEGTLEAQYLLKKEANLEVDYLRLRAYPFTEELKKFLETHERVYVIEQNRDAQLMSLMRMENDLLSQMHKCESILHFDGMPLDAPFVVDQVKALEARKLKGAA
jgi:2-oxoglutarate ferredoxin oxidoreductase subunit alpha